MALHWVWIPGPVRVVTLHAGRLGALVPGGPAAGTLEMIRPGRGAHIGEAVRWTVGDGLRQ